AGQQVSNFSMAFGVGGRGGRSTRVRRHFLGHLLKKIPKGQQKKTGPARTRHSKTASSLNRCRKDRLGIDPETPLYRMIHELGGATHIAKMTPPLSSWIRPLVFAKTDGLPGKHNHRHLLMQRA